MSEELQNTKIKNLEFRAKIPRFVRFFAIAAFAATLIAVGIGFYLNFGREDFRMKGLRELQLSKDVVAEFSNYERRENDGAGLNYLIRADSVRTFTDNHQELENMFLEVFDETGEKSDKITSEKAIYVPDKENSKLFTTFFSGDVKIASRDGLNVETDQLTYKKETEIAEAEEYIKFSRENVQGSAIGAIVNTRLKTLELLKEVEILALGEDEKDFEKIEQAKINAGKAFFDQTAEKIEFSEIVDIKVVPKENGGSLQPTDIHSNSASAIFKNKELDQIDLDGNITVYQKPTANDPRWTKTSANRASVKIAKEVKRVELFENVDIQTTSNNEKPTKIKTQYALYDKDADRFELKNGVEILTNESDKDTVIKSRDAVYEQTKGKILLFGGAEVVQPGTNLRGDEITAFLLVNKNIKSANVKGNAFLKQIEQDKTTEVSAGELNAIFDDVRKLETANTRGPSVAKLIPSNPETYSRVSLTAPNAIKLNFKSGNIYAMNTEGRTTISMNSAETGADASDKTLTADTVKTIWSDGGKDLSKAEAVGNAELVVVPLQNLPENYKTTVFAPRFDCDFFAGNNARSCIAATNVKAVRVPTVARKDRGNQTLSANTMTAYFDQQTKDLDKFEAVGNTKFTELDRNGIADQMSFSNASQVVSLRNGEPTLWDSQARIKAGEIDWDTKKQRSYFRRKVSTTYYSQKKTGGATPFQELNSPVFLTADTAEIDHTTETAVYTGNSRAWQENNYVRADKLVLNQKEGRLNGSGSVQSLLYDAKRKENGKEVKIPVYAASDSIYYLKDKNFLQYEGNVDIRQQTDRITAGIAKIYLNDKNEVSQTIAENNVVITQPNRRASGDYAKYELADESVVIRGNPATVDDRENGSSQAAQMTVYMRDNRVISDSKTPENNSGRIRSVYKVKNQE